MLEKIKKYCNMYLLSKTNSSMPNCKQAFFMPEELVKPTISQHSQGNTIISCNNMPNGWLILQNKPLGEYVERLLLVPRVKPTTNIIYWLFLKNSEGVFTMNTIKTFLSILFTLFLAFVGLIAVWFSLVILFV